VPSLPLRHPGWACLLSAPLLAALLLLPASAQEPPPLTPRQRSVLAGIADYAPFSCPDRYVLELGTVERRTPVLLRALAREGSWVRFLAYASRLEWTPARARANLDALFAGLPAAGKVRQNAIFLAALASPEPAARLRRFLARADLGPEDRVDARCALAALGDADAVRWFQTELAPSSSMRGQPIFRFADYARLEAAEDGRARTRTYRTFEVLTGRPYFRRLTMLQPSVYGLRVRPEAERRPLVRALLPQFLRVWPGHPGSDDFAAILCHEALAAGDRLDAYRWAQRSTLLPDRDRGLRRTFTALADSQLSVAELDALLASEDGAHNRDFLRYARFLKLARRDLARGLEAFARYAQEPASVFARARRAAAEVDVPAGLRDGRDPALTLELLVAYPRRSARLAQAVARQPDDDGARFLAVLSRQEREVARRTGLDAQDSLTLDVPRLAAQYRLLLLLRELQERERGAKAGVCAELRYLRARLLYRNPDAYFPVWAPHHLNTGYDLNAVRCDAEADARLVAYVAEAFHLRRAYAVYASLLAEFPGYPGKDRVLHGLALCTARLMDYRPAVAVDAWVYPDPKPAGEPPKAFAHGRVADWFERLVREHPASALADDAERAAAYRRRMQRKERLRAGR
jgi:hypothetical protein